MTIIDVHAHHTRRDYIHESWWRSMGSLIQRAFRRRGRRMTLEEAAEEFVSRCETFCGDAMVEALDIAGIGQMVVMPLDWGRAAGEPEISVERQNEETAELCARHPGRLIFFAGVDPLRGECSRLLFERMMKDYGAKGLKLHPLSGFYPNQREVYPFYERCLEHDIPVLIHSGIDPPPTINKYGDPIHLDDVCRDFPQLRVMCAHMGGPWREVAVTLADFHPNLWLDLSGNQGLLQRDSLGFYKRLRQDLDVLGPEKICFASDHPYWGSPKALKRWVEAFTNPRPEAAEAGITFSHEEIEGILYRNAQAWLGDQAR